MCWVKWLSVWLESDVRDDGGSGARALESDAACPHGAGRMIIVNGSVADPVSAGAYQSEYSVAALKP